MQKYLFVPLDIFRKIQHNKNIRVEDRLEAWLVFLCMDEPDAIISIIEKYPDFRDMYEQIYDICRNIERVMDMFSKELQELDRNTAQLMIDEMQEELNKERQRTEQKDRELAKTQQAYQEALEQIAELRRELAK